MRFTYTALPGRVVFGAGVLASLADEAALLGQEGAGIVHPGAQRPGTKCRRSSGELAVGIFDRAVMHVPVETANAACEFAQASGADLCVAIGGGSTTGAGEGDCFANCSAHPGRAHHLRRLGNDAHVGTHRRRCQAHRPGSASVTSHDAVRPRAHVESAPCPVRHERNQRDRPLRRESLQRESQPTHLFDGRGRDPGVGRKLAAHRSSARRSRSPQQALSMAPG